MNIESFAFPSSFTFSTKGVESGKVCTKICETHKPVFLCNDGTESFFDVTTDPKVKHRQSCTEFRDIWARGGDCRYKKYICMKEGSSLKFNWYYRWNDVPVQGETCIGFDNTELADHQVWKNNRLCGVPSSVTVTSDTTGMCRFLFCLIFICECLLRISSSISMNCYPWWSCHLQRCLWNKLKK